jgi:hypothetical protein
MLDRMWIEDGYFCRVPYLPKMRFALRLTTPQMESRMGAL